MELDLQYLEKIFNKAPEEVNERKNEKKTSTELSTEKLLTLFSIRNTEKEKNRPTAKITPYESIRNLQAKAEKKKQEKEQIKAIFREYQGNIRTSSQVQAEILKGVKAGEDTGILFLKACKVISAMTSNKVFYNQIEKDLKSIYGIGLGNKAILELEAEEVKTRLGKLNIALLKAETEEDKARIRNAIKNHEKRLEELRSITE